MHKGEALIGRLPSISLAAATITPCFVQVVHVHQGTGHVIPQVGRQWPADVLCHGSVSPVYGVRCGDLSVLVFEPQVTCGGSWEIQSAEYPTVLSDPGPQ